MVSLSHCKVLCYDLGLFTESALRFLRDCASVRYFCPWISAFPEPFDCKIGDGLDGMERIEYFWDHVDDADLIFVPDTMCSDVVEYLRKHNYPVAGVGKAEKLELDRWYGREVQRKNGLPTQETYSITGCDAMMKFLKENKDFYIKLNMFRGLEESFHHIDWHQSEDTFYDIAHALGPYKESIAFICEESMEGPEPGLDAITWEGEMMFPAMVGYEGKGVGIIERVYDKREEFPPALLWLDEGLSPEFKKFKTRFFYSAECKLVKEGNTVLPYLIDNTCFDDKTEILTDKGWKLFKDLDKTEKVATLNPNTFEIEYHKPSAYQEYEHDGDMVSITSPEKAIDLLVTPNHSLWGFQRKTKKRVQTLIESRAGSIPYEFRIPRTGRWIGENIDNFILPEYKTKWHSGKGRGVDRVFHKKELAVPIKPWLGLLGIYLAEGSTGGTKHSTVCISQFSKKEQVKELLSGLPLKVREVEKGFEIGSVQLAKYFRQFGLSHEKFVPDFIKNLTPELINVFLDAFVVGDGTVRPTGSRVFFSNSTRLLDDIQELLFKVGTVGNLYQCAEAGTVFEINGKKYTRNHTTHYLSERIQNHAYNVDKRTSEIKTVSYKGMIYDVTVQNHIIYVRRNGKPTWSGNCRLAAPGTSAIQCEIIKNYSEVIMGLATGERVDPIFTHKYGAAIPFDSPAASKSWINVSFSKDVRRWIKLRMAVKKGNDYYAVPGFESVGSAIGLGNTVDEAVKKAREAIKDVKGKRVDTDSGQMDTIIENIEKGRKMGIPF